MSAYYTTTPADIEINFSGIEFAVCVAVRAKDGGVPHIAIGCANTREEAVDRALADAAAWILRHSACPYEAT